MACRTCERRDKDCPGFEPDTTMTFCKHEDPKPWEIDDPEYNNRDWE